VIDADPMSLFLRGLAALACGIVALAWPGLTVAVLVALFGAYCLVDGVFSLAHLSTRAGRARRRRWLIALQGLASIAAGIVAFVWPDITALVLLYVIAAWAAVTGVLQSAAALRPPAGPPRPDRGARILLGVTGALTLTLAIVLVITPGTGALAITWAIAWYAILWGVSSLVLAHQLRRARQALDEVPDPRQPVGHEGAVGPSEAERPERVKARAGPPAGASTRPSSRRPAVLTPTASGGRRP
jgi:uncharacterized membrane protein HdeD (DUF308 family)